MKRFLPVALALSAAGCSLFVGRAFSFAPNPDRNILFVTIDTLRADALGSYGGKAITPNLDRLASHGARFTFAHSHAVVTLVSHASMLTGRYPYEHGIRDNTGYRLPPNEPTMATRLKGSGFATGAFIGGFPLDHRFGLNAGFDLYDDKLTDSPEGGERERRADLVVKSALSWIDQQHGKWFAWVHVYDPHAPYDPPAEWAARFRSEPYLGEVSWTDAALGPLFDRVNAEPRPTLVVVTGDHGESLGEHGELTHSVFAYESTLHIPLIISELGDARSAVAKERVIDTAVRHVDLLPTVLDAAAAPADPTLPGASLRSVIDAGRGTDRPSYFEAMTDAVERGWAPLRGVLVGREKYIDLPIVELYDLSTDPHETHNVAPEKPQRVDVMYNMLKMFNVAPPARAQVETAETIDRLRSLGYIGGGTTTVREKYTDADDPKRLITLEQTLTKGDDAVKAGQPQQAIGFYKSVIAQRPDTEDAYRKLALVYWRAGDAPAAIATLEDALRHGVTQSEVRIRLGQYLAESGQPAKAIELLAASSSEPSKRRASDEGLSERREARAPNNDLSADPDALVVLWNAYQLAGKLPEAERTFTQITQLDPGNALAFQDLGTAELQAHDYTGAEASLRHALQIDPTLSGAYTALGVVLASTNRKPEAIDAWKRAVQLDATDFNALYNLTINLAEAGRRDEARTYGEQFIRTAPPALRRDAAEIQRLLGRARER
ncbi:MAG: sulfatase-like hydrolase/transferase [Vicinamibacterales bacterium]